jgi:methyltransferase (TIGR00027 family)
METGRASRTAELVCIGRALADGAGSAAGFSDPTAYVLLPEVSQALVRALRENTAPKNLRERMQRAYHVRQSKLMVARTIAIDDAIRAAHNPQLVILGAGLDGRAWRMPELHDVTVYEVDHPDTQRDKRARAAALAQAAREVHFVPMNFERDALEPALANAGHDRARATTWVWEGVVMYLTPADVEATLAAIAQRSAPGSRLIVVYHRPAFMLHIVGLIVRRIGEPLRSSFEPDAMRALLERHGFTVASDESLPAIGARLGPEIARATEVLKHMHIVTADRRAQRDDPAPKTFASS